jgi:hypothetical protein
MEMLQIAQFAITPINAKANPALLDTAALGRETGSAVMPILIANPIAALPVFAEAI